MGVFFWLRIVHINTSRERKLHYVEDVTNYTSEQFIGSKQQHKARQPPFRCFVMYDVQLSSQPDCYQDENLIYCIHTRLTITNTVDAAHRGGGWDGRCSTIFVQTPIPMLPWKFLEYMWDFARWNTLASFNISMREPSCFSLAFTFRPAIARYLSSDKTMSD